MEQARERQLQEQRRLLYVAMTRAKEQLIVTGWERRKNGKDTNWYEMITAGLERMPGAQCLDMRLAPDVVGPGWRLTTRPAPGQRQLGLPLDRQARAAPLPDWLARPVPVEPGLARPLSPSHLDEAGESAASPLDGVDRYRRGRLIHRLLQSLPDRPAGERAAALRRFLAQPGLGLDEAQREEIAAEVVAVLEAPEIAHAFGPGSRAEVPLAGVVGGPPGGQVIAGQVDRLAVSDREVVVIDYKTNRTPPATPDAVPSVYLRQMAAYAALLRQIYPDRRVRCALLWTEGLRLMPLDETVLARHAPDLHS
jgi:ATP-dependent helicase/nuclease subunit A